ncbi:ABC transporter substrate-binding protein [Loigolactobacillus rennini]|uniref:Fe/B12 periplasmic-binding domain-containing protein n=2 Tax=Loigolactobacillus rennini TaxID=238013 RepID=A0A0R2D781_9LACO|nr:ABC transporter substrate-binding protein [Loigolactobacillus rennini]KRM99783.1 hypothetical protein FC24_GL001866 [Loigolactobacillus rennini DSM 20253]SFZ87713.1 Vitamin B12 ABC transporter, B12-binding component BtuF [Loigolactobacillus rennini]
MMKKLIKSGITLLSVFMMILPFTGCRNSQQANKNMTNNTKSTQVITDQAGDKVTVPKKIKRIAVVGILPLPSVLTVFFNSANKLVTIPQPSMAAAKNGTLSQLYPQILKTKTSGNDGADINTEDLKKTNPDVVFYKAEDTSMKKKLTTAGFVAVGISTEKWHHDPILTLNHWISLLSEMFPKNRKAKIVKNYSNQAYKLVQKRIENIDSTQQQKVFFLFQYDGSTILTSGKNHWGNYWANAVGAKNIVNNNGLTVQVTMEQVYKWNPEKIFITNFTPAQPRDLYENKMGHDDWSKVKAVQNKQVYKMPLGMYRSYTPGADTPITLLWMAKTAYPDKFADINIITETKDYYKKVFNVELTTQQAERIFNPSSKASAY